MGSAGPQPIDASVRLLHRVASNCCGGGLALDGLVLAVFAIPMKALATFAEIAVGDIFPECLCNCRV